MTVAKRDEQVGLVARGRELAHIDEFLWQARRGAGGALALRGEPGVGKSALIEAAVARASEFRIVQVRGHVLGEPEVAPVEWPQPLGELARQFDVVAQPRQPALAMAAPPRELAAPPQATLIEAVTKVLRRMIEMTSNPLLVTVDDCQSLPAWFVDAMAHSVLAHLGDQPVSLALAWRDTPHLVPFALDRSGLPQHRLGGLDVAQASRLLSWHFDEPPRDRVLTELVAGTGGNPLALLDVCARLTREQLEGWHPLPDPLPIGDGLVEAFDVGRHLPPPTRRALAIAAVSRVPRDVLIAVLDQLGSDMDDLGPAVDAGIVVDRGRRVDFVHPLVRAAVFHRAPLDVQRAARRSLSVELARNEAIESSAYQAAAAADVDAPDEAVTRRLAEASRVAIERGDPEAAARHEEMAARFAGAGDAIVQHLASAASLWLAVGQADRARRCLDEADGMEVTDATRGEVAYQRARLSTDADESEVANRIVSAADLCVGEAPHRALAMLTDAAARKILADEPRTAEALAERAVRLATMFSSHAEVLAGAVRAAATLRAGRPVEDLADRTRVSLLIGQSERFPSSPEVALVVGRALQAQGMRRQAERWVQWIEWCAERSGDGALAAVPLLLRAFTSLADGRVPDASSAVHAAARVAERSGSPVLAAWGWSLATQVHALTADYEAGFRDCSKLFAVSDRVGRSARLRAMPSLAALEMQQGRAGPAQAWLRTAEEDLFGHRGRTAAGRPDEDAALAEVAPEVASIALLAGCTDAGERWSRVLEEGTLAAGARPEAWRSWLRGVWAEELDEAVEHLAAAADGFAEVPLAVLWIDLCRGARLARAGMPGEATAVLEPTQERARTIGAKGLELLAANELRRLPPPSGPVVADGRHRDDKWGERVAAATATAGWEVTLLGSFSVRHRGKAAHLPPSLATQAIKIVAIESRISVDELVELLWDDAEPGVGARRLRNVLWRIRSACGDLLVREGQLVRLADDAVTDLSRFRELSTQALAHGVPPEQAARTARAALDQYRGELLPGDRYADWASGAREAVDRTYLRLLDLLVDDALGDGRTSEALSLLDRLAEADPYDERHQIQIAEVHLEAGNRRRALDALERAERILDDLGVAPSPAVRRLREALTSP
ncbi:MAG: BTAD domain-containing putative transcriptional regulator [Acidimicrobiales bacterium]